MAPNSVEELLDRVEIGDLALRYARGIDRKDTDLLSSVFTDDAELVGEDSALGPGGGTIAEGILEYHDQVRGYDRTMHFVGNQTLSVDGDSATGETYCVAVHWYDRGDSAFEYRMFIRYLDDLVRRDDEWLFRRREIAVDQEYAKELPSEGKIPHTG
ncbi:MAG: nuclear transport factor 2 family protein [Haloferacaceae archaeon]